MKETIQTACGQRERELFPFTPKSVKESKQPQLLWAPSQQSWAPPARRWSQSWPPSRKKRDPDSWWNYGATDRTRGKPGNSGCPVMWNIKKKKILIRKPSWSQYVLLSSAMANLPLSWQQGSTSLPQFPSTAPITGVPTTPTVFLTPRLSLLLFIIMPECCFHTGEEWGVFLVPMSLSKVGKMRPKIRLSISRKIKENIFLVPNPSFVLSAPPPPGSWWTPGSWSGC